MVLSERRGRGGWNADRLSTTSGRCFVVIVAVGVCVVLSGAGDVLLRAVEV
jgi:hypothetical protein